MIKQPLTGKKTAILVANGFAEQDLIKTQRAIQQLGGDTRIVSMDQGLVNSWNAEGWGLNFAADQALNGALAADYDSLIIPGGQRSMDKLKLTAHTRRFINGFLDCGKPVACVNEALDIMAFTELLGTRNVVAETEDCIVDGNLFSCRLTEESQDAVLEALNAFILNEGDAEQEAVAA